jgi:hypothetical protein
MCLTRSLILLNKLSPFPAFGYGSAFSSTSRLGLRPTWNVSSLKSTRSGWRFYHHDSAQISSNKPMVKSASDAALISRRLRNTQGERILWVDLAYKIEYGVGEVVHFSPEVASTTEGRQEGEIWPMLMKVKQLVKEDRRKAPSERIDSVVWYTLLPEEPTAGMWRVLDGLSPKHLELFASTEYEDCYIKTLNSLRRQWNDLESLTLHNICEPDFMKHAPKVFSRISSLTLNHCSGTEHFPPDVTHLKHLRLLENNSCDMFSYAVDNFPNLAKGLEVLEIKSTNGDDFLDIYDPQDFRERLRKCTKLRQFRFAANYPNSLDIDLASYIPSSVQNLSLRFTRSLPFLHDIDNWIERASDRTWLPHLKSFQLTVDPESRVGGLEGDVTSLEWTRNLENPPRKFSPEAFDVEFEEKRRVLYDVLKSNRWFIELLT